MLTTVSIPRRADRFGWRRATAFTLTFLDFKEMGVGLAVAVLIDATIVRGALLPASMKVLGDWNWYLPSWLEWLPHAREPKPSGAMAAPGTAAGSPQSE